ncbi:MAG: DEAD/DEAH box helicase, partial [Armatimonadota bacterium]|nr:DEAD/DEAH box helicase [Armatimonadota bacterium]
QRVTKLAAVLERRGDRPVRFWNFLTKRRLRAVKSHLESLACQADRLLHQAVPEARKERLRLLRDRLNHLVQEGRPRFQHLSAYLENRSSRHDSFPTLAQMGVPIAVTNLSVSANLPLKPGLFDVLIVDEASTCDPASLLPLLYRAKRAVIVGDPNQLPHITGEGWKRVKEVPQLRGGDGMLFSADFGESAFHLCSALLGDPQRAFLSDHFRCPPHIIRYVNREFYGGRLRIHTEEKGRPVALREAPGEHTRPKTGSLLNQAHLEAAIGELKALGERYPSASVGLVTPYRAFADAVRERVQDDEALRTRYQEGALLVGTAHRFQGSEVDYLVFATVAGDNAGDRELRWVQKNQLFNVAITRARRFLTLVASPSLLADGKLRRVTRLLESPDPAGHNAGAAPHPFAQKVAQQLELMGLQNRVGIDYNGYPLDILDARVPPRWGMRCLPWHDLSQLTLDAVLLQSHDDAVLARKGVKVVCVVPADWEDAVARFAAQIELAPRYNGAPPEADPS